MKPPAPIGSSSSAGAAGRGPALCGGAGLGAKYLSRRDSEIVGMIGSGGMARTYLDAFCQVRKIKMVKVFSPNRKHVEDYAEEVSKRHGIKVESSPSAREAVRGVDIVSICTSTNEPAFENEWLEPGMHVTNLTSADVKPDLPQVVDVAVRGTGEGRTLVLENRDIRHLAGEVPSPRER